MNNVLVISDHPNLENSYTNKVILSRLEASSEDIVVHRLDERYPDFNIDVDVEQKALKQADVILLQFPFYWYSVPALMKKWLDDVFSFNFAYGPEGDKLKDKAFILSFTVGGPEEAYTPIGYNHFRIEELIKPLEQTAYLAGIYPPEGRYLCRRKDRSVGNETWKLSFGADNHPVIQDYRVVPM